MTIVDMKDQLARQTLLHKVAGVMLQAVHMRVLLHSLVTVGKSADWTSSANIACSIHKCALPATTAPATLLCTGYCVEDMIML